MTTVLICERADGLLTTRGASFDHHCGKCKHRCSCYTKQGAIEDPPELSRRDCAKAAAVVHAQIQEWIEVWF